MNPHFFTAPFYFAFIWFRVQGSGFKVQGSGFRVEVAASPPFFRWRATLENPSAPPLRHPERSRGIFLARPPYARMRPHSNDALVLPFIAFLSLTFYRAAKRIPPLRSS